MKGRDRVQLLLYTELYVLQCSDRDVTKLLPWEPHSAENYGGLTLDVGLFCASVSMKCPQVLASLLYRYQLVKGFIGMLYCWRVGKPTLQHCGSEIELCSHLLHLLAILLPALLLYSAVFATVINSVIRCH